MASPTEILTVQSVFIDEEENANLHHTSKYELVHRFPPSAVLRRGQPFELAVRFNKPYTPKVHTVQFTFNFGKNPNVIRGTQGIGILGGQNTSWDVRLKSSHGTMIDVEVTSPADSPVGLWHLEIQTFTYTSSFKAHSRSYEFDLDIYFLFNPWLKEDSVYMENPELLDEYVSNDTGKIWVGASPKSCKGRKWIFGQFHHSVLPACQFLLERSGIEEASQADPIEMSRAISKIVNAENDKGVLAGGWDGEYPDGTVPSAWTGSVPILEQYLSSRTPVKWGQCWVFAGVLTTVCRALGLPSRPVSNFLSAHGTNGTFSIDRLHDAEFMYRYDRHGKDENSIWNFHVWNEVWMTRRDLPHENGGWQAVDSTTRYQVTSGGKYQCGPTSVEAIKQGTDGYNYDVPLMLAAVNADVIHWIEDNKGVHGWRRMTSDTNQIGKLILTKAPSIFDVNGETDREVITQNYKNMESTEAERLTLLKAIQRTEGARKFYSIPDQAKDDVEFELVDVDGVNVGEPFTVTVYVKNKSKSLRSGRVRLHASSVLYTGMKKYFVTLKYADFFVGPEDREVLVMTVDVDDYTDKLAEYGIIQFEALATVVQTSQYWFGENHSQIIKPTINIQIEDTMIVGLSTAITLSFKNPLSKNLTECEFNYAGIGPETQSKLPCKDIQPGELVTVRLTLQPRKAGKSNLIVTFTSRELVDVTGWATVRVLDGPNFCSVK